MTLLARRDFTVRELSERLIERGIGEAAAAAAVAELLRDGVLDDGRYAHNYVAYHAGRGQEPALAAGPDWSALARKVCRAKFGPEPPDSWALRARRARFLQYRGFSSDHIRAATGAEPETGFSEP